MTDAVTSRLHLKDTTIDFKKIAKSAEMMAATNTLTAEGCTKIAEIARGYVDQQHHQTCQFEPKAMAMWCLQLASAGITDNSVFEAVATAVVDLCAAPVKGPPTRQKRAKKDRWVPGSNPLRPTRMWLMRIGSQLASAGVHSPELYRRLHSLCLNTSESEEQLAIETYATTPEHLAELTLWCGRQKNAMEEMLQGNFTYFSDLPMLLTHRADTAMHGQMTEFSLPPEWDSIDEIDARIKIGLQFKDPSLPVMIDAGCGRGSFLLCLACRSTTPCNYLGVERSPFLVRKATGLAKRWGVSGKVRFVVGSASRVLERLADLPAVPSVKFVCVQFPTPFSMSTPDSEADGDGYTELKVKAKAKAGGVAPLSSMNQTNPHLPSQFQDFLASPSLAKNVARLLAPAGQVFLQTNTEDVAVAMRQTFEALPDIAIVPTPAPTPHAADGGASAMLDHTPAKRSRRSTSWAEQGGTPAEGGGWLQLNPWSVECGARLVLVPVCVLVFGFQWSRNATQFTMVACFLHVPSLVRRGKGTKKQTNE